MVEFLNDEKEDRETPLCSFLFYLCLFVFLSCCSPSRFHSIYRFLYLTNYCVLTRPPRLLLSRLLAFPLFLSQLGLPDRRRVSLVYFFLAAGFTRNSPPSSSSSSPSLPFPIVSPVRAVGITLAYTLFHFLGRVRRCIRA